MVPVLTTTEVVATARTGDVWLFRGRSGPDRAIRVFTNAPVNHAAMVVALDDLPPLLWHTELGQSLESVWTGERHRGAQLNRLDEALEVWTQKYKQLAFVRHFDGEITREMEDSLLRVVAEYEGRPFPRTRRLVGKWLQDAEARSVRAGGLLRRAVGDHLRMGLLDPRTPGNWFDPGKFWSGDRLELLGGAALGPEIAVTLTG
jgi:hypothetical protein